MSTWAKFGKLLFWVVAFALILLAIKALDARSTENTKILDARGPRIAELEAIQRATEDRWKKKQDNNRMRLILKWIAEHNDGVVLPTLEQIIELEKETEDE